MTDENRPKKHGYDYEDGELPEYTDGHRLFARCPRCDHRITVAEDRKFMKRVAKCDPCNLGYRVSYEGRAPVLFDPRPL